MKNIAIFASGSGTNAQRIAEYFKDHPCIRVSIILSNNPKAYVLERAAQLGIESVLFDRTEFYETNRVVHLLTDKRIDFIVLAGFLWLIPVNLLQAYPSRIINIHPALLPNYGGKGMYGMKVHEAVIAAGEAESGITIHYVNEKYDEGQTIFQARCTIHPDDTPDSLAEKIHTLEYRWFPEVIEQVVESEKLR